MALQLVLTEKIPKKQANGFSHNCNYCWIGEEKLNIYRTEIL